MYKITSLGEIANVTTGYPFKGDLYSDEGIRVVRGENITIGSLRWDSTKCWNSKFEQTEKYSLKEDDVVIGMDGSRVGKNRAQVKERDLPLLLAQRVACVRSTDLSDQNYLYYLIRSEKFEQYVNKIQTGSSIPHISLRQIEEFPVAFPPLSTQQKIASVLSALDSKIELNDRINAELEAMAKTFYDYWFVQFDFLDKNGKPYKTSGGKMVWNDELNREIPEGWEVKTLLDIATFVNGLACQKFRPKENEDSYRVIKIREMGTGFTKNSEFVSKNIPEKVVVFDGDILFSWSATLDVKIWTGGTGALNQHIFKITSEKYPKSFYYFELLNYLQHFKMMAELRKTTMGHITQDHLRESRITIPSIEIINELDKIIKPILEKKVKLEIENQKLIELRDWLLPMLMNEQVKVD
jgi:type I restriction enzyme S subunit